MKIQENYFYKLDNLKEVKVIWKKYDKANILEIGVEYPTAIVDLDRFSGIELNEEWLLKFGFEFNGFIKVLGDKVGKSYNIKNFGLQIVDCGYYYKAKIESTEILNFKYVHRLQELFFALKDEELVVSDAVS